MEKSFREVAKEFLTEMALERGKSSKFGGETSDIIKHTLVCDCPLLKDNGEEDKMIISRVFVMEHNGVMNVSISSQDYYTRHIDRYTDDEVRLFIRSICAGLGLTDLWVAKLAK